MATLIVRPSKIQAGRSANQRIFVTLAGATWTSGTTFTISGVTGVTKIGQNVDSPTQALITITTTTATLTSQTLTVSDGTNTGTTTICPVAPTHRKWFPGLRH